MLCSPIFRVCVNMWLLWENTGTLVHLRTHYCWCLKFHWVFSAMLPLKNATTANHQCQISKGVLIQTLPSLAVGCRASAEWHTHAIKHIYNTMTGRSTSARHVPVDSGFSAGSRCKGALAVRQTASAGFLGRRGGIVGQGEGRANRGTGVDQGGTCRVLLHSILCFVWGWKAQDRAPPICTSKTADIDWGRPIAFPVLLLGRKGQKLSSHEKRSGNNNRTTGYSNCHFGTTAPIICATIKIWLTIWQMYFHVAGL